MPSDHNPDPLVAATLRLVDVLNAIHEQLRLANNNQVILIRMAEMEKRIMEAIDTFAATVNAAFDSLSSAADSLGTAVDATNTALTGIAGDVDFLKAEILKLQNSPGTLTPADQATLDGLQARAATLSTKVAAVSTTMTAVEAAASALDAATATPPAPPAP